VFPATAAALSFWYGDDGEVVYAAYEDGTVRLFDRSSGQEIEILLGHDAPVGDLALSDNGRRLATFSDDGTVRVWHTGSTTLGEIAAFDPRTAEHTFYLANSMTTGGGLAAAPVMVTDSRKQLWARQGEDREQLEVFEASNGVTLQTFSGHAGALSPDGSKVAFQAITQEVTLTDEEAGVGLGGRYLRFSSIRVHDVRTGEQLTELEGLCDWLSGASPEIPLDGCGPPPEPFADWLLNLRFSPDGTLVAAGHGRSIGALSVWDSATGERIWFSGPLGDTGKPHIVRFSPDGRWLAANSRHERSELFVYETETWSQVARLPVDDPFAEFDFTADSTRIVGGGFGGLVTVIDTATWDVAATWQAPEEIRGAALDPNGRLYATAGSGSTLTLWDLTTRSVVSEWTFSSSELRNVLFLDEDRLLVTPRHDGDAVVLTLDIDLLEDEARSRLTRTLTAEECATYRIDSCPTLDQLREG
jgi:WD40 repeat protein